MLLFLKDSLKKKTLKHVCGSGSALIHVVEDLLVLEPDSGDNQNWQQLEHVLRYLTTNVVQKKNQMDIYKAIFYVQEFAFLLGSVRW